MGLSEVLMAIKQLWASWKVKYKVLYNEIMWWEQNYLKYDLKCWLSSLQDILVMHFFYSNPYLGIL